MALRDISQVPNDKVAFGVKRTSMGGQGSVARSRLMWWTTPAPGIECAKG